MPSLIGGPVKITGIDGGSTVNFGDTGFIAPKSTSKSYSGSGVGLTGDFASSINGIANVTTADPDVVDSNLATGT